MEEFEDNDFSDLYADVEVQASSAITALQRLTEMPPEDDRIPDKATRGDEREGDGFRFSGAEIARSDVGFYEHATRGEDEGSGLTKLPMDNGVIRECDDGNMQRFDVNCGNSNSSIEFGAVNTRKHGGVDGTGKSVEGGDYKSQNLIYDCSDSKKTRVNEMDSQLYRVCVNGDTDEDSDRDHYFRRANEGNRLAHVYDSVHISDSVEDSRHVVSECDSEGMSDLKETSDYTNRRNSSSMSSGDDSASSSSPSHRSLSDGYKSYKHLKNLSSVVVRDFEVEATREYHHPFKDSRRHQVEPKARARPAGRYCERQRGLSQHKKSNDMHERKTHWTNEDASYVSVYGKPRAMLNFDSKEKDMSSFSYSNVHVGPTHLENQIYRDIHPSVRYKEGWFEGRDTSERRNILQSNCKLDNKALEDERYHHKRRHVQCNSEQSRRVLPKYPSAVGTRGTQFSNIGDTMHFRRKTEWKYDDKLIEDYKRYVPSGGRCRDQLDHRYDRNITHDGRRGKRRRDNSLDSFHNLQYMKTVGNDRRHVEHRPLAFDSYEKTRGPRRLQSPGYNGPKPGVPERNMRCSWKKMDTEIRQYGTDTYVMNENMKDHHDHDRYLRGRHHQQFKVLPSRVEVYKPKRRDDTTFHSEEPSYHFERISRNNRTDDRHASGHVTELIDERELDRHRFKMMREDHNKKFYGCHKFIQPRSCVQMHQRYQDSDDPLLVIEGKKITSEAGNDKSYGRHDIRKFNDKQKDLDDFKAETTVLTGEKTDANISNKLCHDTFDVDQKNEFLDIEEGQIITEEIDEDPVECGTVESENVTSNGNGVVEGLGEDKIREIIAKMEKRRERFKEPITLSKDGEKILLDSDVETSKGKLGRPARKRRWFGN